MRPARSNWRTRASEIPNLSAASFTVTESMFSSKICDCATEEFIRRVSGAQAPWSLGFRKKRDCHPWHKVRVLHTDPDKVKSGELRCAPQRASATLYATLRACPLRGLPCGQHSALCGVPRKTKPTNKGAGGPHEGRRARSGGEEDAPPSKSRRGAGPRLPCPPSPRKGTLRSSPLPRGPEGTWFYASPPPVMCNGGTGERGRLSPQVVPPRLLSQSSPLAASPQCRKRHKRGWPQRGQRTALTKRSSIRRNERQSGTSSRSPAMLNLDVGPHK